MNVGPLLAHLDELQVNYAEALRQAAVRQSNEQDVSYQCLNFAATADRSVKKLAPLRQRYTGRADWTSDLPGNVATLLEELRSLYLSAQAVSVTWVMAQQAGKALRDTELKDVAGHCHTEMDLQAKWFLTRIRTGAPQALVVE
jgi:hypothetical protein